MTIRSTKTGNRTKNRTRTNWKILGVNQPVYQDKFTGIIFLIRPPEVQKPETGPQTGNFYGSIGM